MIDKIFSSDWRDTRLVRQNGGLIRPKLIFDAEVHPNFQVAKKRSDRGRMLGVITGSMMGWYEDTEFDVPLAVPGLAIKKSLKSIENIKHRDGVEEFYFKQNNVNAVNFYRSTLWPEPDEDDVMAAIWERLMAHLMITDDTSIAAIDDPKTGYLDNGYRVNGEFTSAGKYDRSELFFRGILEDATRGISLDPDEPLHKRNQIFALIRLGKPQSALPLIEALEKVKGHEYFCLFARYHAHWQLRDDEVAESLRKECVNFDNQDCRSQFLKAIDLAMAGDDETALREIELALENYKLDDISLRRSDILALKEAVEDNNIRRN